MSSRTEINVTAWNSSDHSFPIKMFTLINKLPLHREDPISVVLGLPSERFNKRINKNNDEAWEVFFITIVWITSCCCTLDNCSTSMSSTATWLLLFSWAILRSWVILRAAVSSGNELSVIWMIRKHLVILSPVKLPPTQRTLVCCRGSKRAQLVARRGKRRTGG